MRFYTGCCNLKYASECCHVVTKQNSDLHVFRTQVRMQILANNSDKDQVLTTWSKGGQNGLVLNLWLCDVTELKASKSDIKIK